MSKINIPELLAPAGSMEALKAAVNAGADAVYLSGKRFGARQFAQNFSLTEMEEALNYAHLRGVKVYVTVNTLIKETELSLMADYLLQLYSLGVDAVIVQDLSVAGLARELVPDLDLHCSTQMTIHNPQGVSWAADNGFKRVVLAREMSLEDIETAACQLPQNIELEVFAHGAICYSYSGQCLLSSFIGGRSGNRGMCAQPCRKNYQLILVKTDKYGKYKEHQEIPLKDHYLLSTRDLAIYSHLDRIVKAPVDSVKIEGRMRPPEYVANVVKVYREALDRIARGKWKTQEEELSTLKMCFNRGLTKGWLLGALNQQMMERNRPGNRGLYLGRVVNPYEHHGKTIINVKSIVKPEKGDGILFKQPGKKGDEDDLWGTVLDQSPEIKKGKLFLKLHKPVEVGSEVFITRRKALVDMAQEIINNPHLPQMILLDLEIKWNPELIPLIRVNVRAPFLENIEIEYEADFSMEKARTQPLSNKTIIDQLRKTGGTPFLIKNIQMDYPGNLFTPLRNLNHLRRQILEKTQKEILSIYQPSSKEIKSAEKRLSHLKRNLIIPEERKKEMGKNGKSRKKEETPSSSQPTHHPTKLSAYVDSVSSLEAVLEVGCEKIYFQPKINDLKYLNKLKSSFYGLKQSVDYETYFENISLLLTEASALVQKYETRLIWKWPDITSENYLEGATRLLGTLPEKTIHGVMVGGLGALWALRDGFDHVNIYGSGALNIWNHLSVDELSSSFESFTLSSELFQEELKKVILNSKSGSSQPKFEFLVQGNLEALVSENCLSCMLKDENPNFKSFKRSEYQFLGIKDFKNRIFPVKTDDECHTHILNSVELCLIDYLPLLLDMGFDGLVIDARNKPVDYSRKMFPLYQTALELSIHGGPHLDKKLHSLKRKVKKISNGGITTGNFLRGVHEDY